jgi:hypothetical protein
MARQHAADQSRTKPFEPLHHRQRREPHRAELVGSRGAFVNPGEHLHLLADLGIRRQVGRFGPTMAEAFGGFPLGSVIFRFLPLVH